MRSYIFDKKEKAVFDLLRNCISNDCTRKNLCHSYYDGNGNIYAKKHIAHTDLEKGKYKFYLMDNVLLLPSEY